MEQTVKQRGAILMLLYGARRTETKHSPGFVAEADIRDALGECEFNLGVLVELGHIRRDGYKYRITGQGVEVCERGTLT